jgi:hypothetical protein
VKIGPDEKHCQRIIARPEKQQRGNINDELYVAAALLCDTLLTCDKSMAKVARLFNEIGFWNGKVLELSPPKGKTILDRIMAL